MNHELPHPVSFNEDSLERMADMPVALAYIIYAFHGNVNVSIGGKIFNKATHTIDQVKIAFGDDVITKAALSEIKTYQDTLDRESKGIPTLELIRGNVRYYFGKIF